MTPFIRVNRDASTAMLQRDALMAKPAEFFRPFFDNQLPDQAQKIFWIEAAIQRMSWMTIYENDTYHVEVADAAPFIHLNIRRHDLGNCKEWKEIQQIKNELIGPQHEAVELFPSEERLVDTSNEYHLWVHADRNYRFPFGFLQRLVLDRPVMAIDAQRSHRAQPIDGVVPTRRSAVCLAALG